LVVHSESNETVSGNKMKSSWSKSTVGSILTERERGGNRSKGQMDLHHPHPTPRFRTRGGPAARRRTRGGGGATRQPLCAGGIPWKGVAGGLRRAVGGRVRSPMTRRGECGGGRRREREREGERALSRQGRGKFLAPRLWIFPVLPLDPGFVV
jgi:hypothetical protein